MFRLLIADDEELVRRGLTALIEREAPEIAVVGSAVDGLEALEMAQQSAPDIVLTDIRMPGLSGLDLIQRLRAMAPAPHCIILSGYNEFDYARRAVGLGVVDYLLKPVDPDELLALLTRVREQITAEQQDQQARSMAARLAMEQRVQRLLGGFDVDVHALAPYLSPSRPWGLLLIQLISSAGLPHSSSANDALIAACRAQLRKAAVVEDAYGYLCLLLPLSEHDPAALAAAAQGLFHALGTAGWTVAVTVARPCSNVTEVNSRYQEALEVAEYHGMGNDYGPLLCWEVLPTPAEHWPALPTTYRDAILDAIDKGTEWDATRAARAFMSYLREHLSLGAMRALWFEMIVLVIHHVQQVGIRADTLFDAQHNLRAFLTGSVDVGQLEAHLVALVVRAAHARTALRHSHVPRGTIAELRAYIESHPDADLTITTLARRVHLNTKYLGELFKQTTGEPLGKFIIRVRMRRACELLAATPLKVYAIAEQVGYSDPKHFTTMFRSVIGVSPAEYRAQHHQMLAEAVEGPS